MLDECSKMGKKEKKWLDARMSLNFFSSNSIKCHFMCIMSGIYAIDYVLKKKLALDNDMNAWHAMTEHKHIFAIHNLGTVYSKETSWSIALISNIIRNGIHSKQMNMKRNGTIQRPHAIDVWQIKRWQRLGTLNFGWLLIGINARYVSSIN